MEEKEKIENAEGMEEQPAIVEETVEVKTPNKDKFNARMKSRYPDREFADDEDMYGQINSDYDEADENKKVIDMLNGMMDKDPRSATFLSKWHNGEDPLIALVENFGEEIVSGISDPENVDKIAQANKEYMERIAKSKELDEEYDKNLSETNAMVEGMKSAGKYDEGQIEAGLGFLQEVFSGLLVGKLSEEALVMGIKAVSHDADVEQAAAEAEVKGRNANIQSQMRRSKGGDGLPVLGGGNMSNQKKEENNKLGALGIASKRKSIWD